MAQLIFTSPFMTPYPDFSNANHGVKCTADISDSLYPREKSFSSACTRLFLRSNGTIQGFIASQDENSTAPKLAAIFLSLKYIVAYIIPNLAYETFCVSIPINNFII